MRRLNSLIVFCVLLLTCGLAAQCSPCTIWTSATVPTIADSGESASVELGVKFRADSTGYVTGVRFYKSAANGGTHIGNLWDSSGTLLATAQFTGESATGWQQANFSTPVLIMGGTTYVASYFTPLGHYAFDMAFFGSSGVDSTPLHALADGLDGGNGVYTYASTTSFPISSYNSTNYWVDVVYVPQGSTVPPTVTATSPVNAAGGVSVVAPLSASFSLGMDPTTINTTTFQLLDPTNTPVPGTVSYVAATTSAIFQPSVNLAYSTTYTAVIRGTAKDFFGDNLGVDFSWSFTTASAPTFSLCPCTIWSATTLPGLQDSGDGNAVALGVKFRADLNGYITGIRFYKSAANTGSHIGNVWTTGGALLGSASFSGESSAGWQQATFSSPIPVTAGTIYVASYFTSTGHYSFDQNYFAIGVDNVPLHAPSSGASGGNGVYIYSPTNAFPNSNYNASNYWVDVVYVPQNSSAPPVILSTAPGNGTTGAALNAAVSVQFNEPMDPSTITASAFQLVDSSNSAVSGTVSYVPASASLVFQPSLSLIPQTMYTATVRGTVRDTFGNALGNDQSWSFTTAPPPGDSGPGGPILVIASSVNPFSRYLGEILLAEGMNEFLVKDITTVTPAVLSQYDIAILGDFTLTSNQASMLSTWVNGGGGLIAMHPDPQLASLLGLTPTGQSLAEAYFRVNTQTAPGSGIYSQPMQYHGSADLYNLSGAAALATLYSNSTTATTAPALTLANAGAGQAAAFTYDLARSIVELRQGNPAWSGQERVNYVDPATGTVQIRSADLFFGNASFDPQPDWVNLVTQVQIPQADEQQRLLANMIQLMNASRKPLPRFWYLPSGFKAAVIMTGDDHGANGTQTRFDTYIAESPANCSVPDWTCVRATSYIFPANVTVANYTNYIAQGFELANHSDNDPTCTNFTPASLDASITASLGRMTQYFPLAPPSQTNRTHCVLWSDYDSEPTILLNHGIRLDTTYYYWPDLWVQGRPGLFTGSGLPMRYADRNGNTINIYQAPTQFPDETTTFVWPDNANTIMDNALGSQGFYAVITLNLHTDTAIDYYSNDIVASAQSRGIPVVSALQMLTWLDGRNNSTFRGISWSANTLSFTVGAASGARNLQVMVPATTPSGNLASLTLAGAPVTYSLQTIKGLQYAVFLTTGGAYQATYTPTHSLSGTISGSGGSGATVALSGTASATTTADASGNFTFNNLVDGTYTVTPSYSGYTFTPANRSASLNGSNVVGVNFSSVLITYSISGTISGAGGNGATVRLSGAAAATTTASASGTYSFSGLANGAYTVTPSKTGFTFTPSSQSVTVSNGNGTANFGTLTFAISGTVSGTGGNAATVTLSGGATATTTASASGTYSFSGLGNGAYTVTPSKTGFSFTPTTQNITVNNASVSAVNFATVTYSISGTISGAGGNAATVTLTGAATATTTASASGSYTLSAPSNGAYTVTPSKTGYTFNPTSQAATVSGANLTGVNFTSTAIPAAQLSPASINFGTVLYLSNSSNSTVTLRNTGGATLTISAIATTGTNPGDFVISSQTCGTTLAANATCTVSLHFTPQAAGARAAALTFTDNAANSPQSVSLTGTGTMVGLSSKSITFGAGLVGTTSTASNDILTNAGPSSLAISGITITGTNPGDFSQTSNCGTTLAAKGTCTIAIRFTPTARGIRSATLRATDSDPTSPQLVTLTGVGL